MARRGKPAVIELSQEQRVALEGWARRAKTAQVLAMRARIVLRAAAGLSSTAIARQFGLDLKTVSKWRRRFLEQGVDGLLDEPRAGQPRKSRTRRSKR